MQPTQKTKSTDFLPQKPSMDGLNKPLPSTDNTSSKKEIDSGSKATFEPPKPSTHIIDLKSNTASEEIDQNKTTHVDMVAPNNNSISTSQPDDALTDTNQTSNNQHQSSNTSESHVETNKKKSSKVKWLLIALVIVILLIVAVVGGIYFAGQNTTNTTTNHNNMNM